MTSLDGKTPFNSHKHIVFMRNENVVLFVFAT